MSVCVSATPHQLYIKILVPHIFIRFGLKILFWVKWNQLVQVHMHITPRIKKVLIKNKSVLKSWDRWVYDRLIDKYGIKWKKVLCGSLLKSVSAVRCSVKSAFLESVSLYSQMLGATDFGLVLGDCIVIAMTFIQKYVVKMSRISFYEFLKIPIITV